MTHRLAADAPVAVASQSCDDNDSGCDGFVGNPMETGLIARLSRPDGNFTGVVGIASGAGRQERSTPPRGDALGAACAALLNAKDPFVRPLPQQIQLAARTVAFDIQPIRVSGTEELEVAFSQVSKGRNGRWQLTDNAEGSMRSHSRPLTLVTLLALTGVLIVAVVNRSAQAADPRIGTWKLNAAKSKYDPGPPPQSLTVKVEPAGQGEKVTAEFVNADGSRTSTVYTANFDGKDSPLTGSQIANTVALKRVDARTTVRTDKKDGKIVQTLTRVVAQDGKTMTVTVKGTNAQGQPVNNVVVFDKQ